MRTTLTVLRYTLVRNWRDSSSIVEQILQPLGLILVLGLALGGAFEARDIGPTPVAYVIEAQTPAAESVRAFLTREDVASYLSTTDAGSMAAARELLENRDVVTVVHVPPEFDGRGELQLIERADNTLRTGIVRAVVRNYTHGASVTVALAQEGIGVDYAPMPADFETREISRSGRAPGAFDFYAISMLVLTVMYVAGYSVDSLREDLLDPIGRRVRSTGINRWAHLSGKLGANAISGLIQAAVIVLVTLVVFGANWGDRPFLLVALVGSITAFAVALGGLVLALVRDGQRAQSIVNTIVLGSMIVSGGAIRFGSLGPGFHALQRLLPHYQGQTALLAIVYDGASGAIPEAFIYFVGGAAVALVLTIVLSRRAA